MPSIDHRAAYVTVRRPVKPNMSARQLDLSPAREFFAPVPAGSPEPLRLPAEAVRVRRSGIEFHYSRPLAICTEAVVRLCRAGEDGELTCTGVVVSCTGSPRAGYHVGMVLIGLTPGTERALAALAHSQLS
jgi:hypothetical protein